MTFDEFKTALPKTAAYISSLNADKQEKHLLIIDNLAFEDGAIKSLSNQSVLAEIDKQLLHSLISSDYNLSVMEGTDTTTGEDKLYLYAVIDDKTETHSFSNTKDLSEFIIDRFAPMTKGIYETN